MSAAPTSDVVDATDDDDDDDEMPVTAVAHQVSPAVLRAKAAAPPPDAPEDDEASDAPENEAEEVAPEASPSAPTSTKAPPRGGLPSRGARSRIPRPGAKPPRPVAKDASAGASAGAGAGTAASAGAETLDSDTKRVKRPGPAKLRRETDTEVKSPHAFKPTDPADEPTDLRLGKSSPFGTPPAAKLPDKTAAMPSIPDSEPSGGSGFDPEAEIRAASDAALAALERRKMNAPGATASALFEEDEDGPTMVAPIPAEVKRAPLPARAGADGAPPPRPIPPPHDEEQTAVHPHRLPKPAITEPPPPLEASVPSVPPVSHPVSMPQPREMVPTAPPPVVNPPPQDLAPPSANRVQAAFDAASVMPLEAKMIAERKARSYDTVAASILGFGMITAALASYLASGVPEKTAGYFGVVALTAVAMFLVGMGPIQKRNETKITFIALGAVMLAFTLIRLLFVAI